MNSKCKWYYRVPKARPLQMLQLPRLHSQEGYQAPQTPNDRNQHQSITILK